MRKRVVNHLRRYFREWIHILLLLILFVALIYQLFDTPLRDIYQAITDSLLELTITAIFLVFLSYIGFRLAGRSLNIAKPTTPPKKHTPPVPHWTPDWARPAEPEKETKTWWNNFWQGISTEMFGAVVTTVAFGVVLLIFQQYQIVQSRKADLILQMRSPNHDFSVEAYRQLIELGWIHDGTLENADLRDANLHDMDFESANLQGANLSGANLQDAILIKSNLQNVDLANADLRGANLTDANLQNSSLWATNLQGAILWNANLQGARSRSIFASVNLGGASLQGVILQGSNLMYPDLRNADLSLTNLDGVDLSTALLQGANLSQSNLRGADLSESAFDEKTILPDATGERNSDGNLIYDKYWTPKTDMSRYTDSNHPDFWQPDWVTIWGHPPTS